MAGRVLVTGGAGFLGSHLVDHLLRDGYHVTVIDNLEQNYDVALKRHNIRPHLSHPAYSLIVGDISDLHVLQRDLTGDYDVIVHLAAKVGERSTDASALQHGEVNIVGTHNLLELARERGIEQFVFASTSGVYGPNSTLPWREDDEALLPRTCHSATKLSCERLGQLFSQRYGIRFVGLRLSTIYGPRQRPDQAIHRFTRLMLAGQAIPVFGDGSSRRDYLFVADAVAGIRAAMAYDRAQFEVFNLGGTQMISVRESLQTLQGVLGVDAALRCLDAHPGDQPLCQPNLFKSRLLLDYRPKTEFRDGIQSFANWFRCNQHLVLASSDNTGQPWSEVESRLASSRILPN